MRTQKFISLSKKERMVLLKRAVALVCSLLLCLTLVGVQAGASSVDSAAILTAVETFLNAELNKLADNSTDGWQRFLCQQGVGEVEANLDRFDVTSGKPLSVSFLLANGSPQVKKQPAYDGDAKSWLAGMVTTMRTPNTKTKLNLLITQEGGGYTVAYGKGAEATLSKAIVNLGKKASKGLTDKTILAALVDYLMPPSVAILKKLPDNLDLIPANPAFAAFEKENGLDVKAHPYLSALFSGIKGHKLDATQGPEKLTLTYSMPDLESRMDRCFENTKQELAYDAKAKQYTQDDMKTQYGKQLGNDLLKYRYEKNADKESSYTFSLLALPAAIDPTAYYDASVASLDADVNSFAADLVLAASEFPDYPAIRDPKAGVVDGASSGTTMTYKAPKDGYSRCISVYNRSGTLVSTTFLPNGGRARIKIPQGYHRLIYGIGHVWYGPVHLFGDAGHYSYEDDFEIKSRRWVHTITFNAVEEEIYLYYWYPNTLEEVLP